MPGASVKSTEIVFEAEGWIGVAPEPEVSEVRRLEKFVKAGVVDAVAGCCKAKVLSNKVMAKTSGLGQIQKNSGFAE